MKVQKISNLPECFATSWHSIKNGLILVQKMPEVYVWTFYSDVI